MRALLMALRASLYFMNFLILLVIVPLRGHLWCWTAGSEPWSSSLLGIRFASSASRGRYGGQSPSTPTKITFSRQPPVLARPGSDDLAAPQLLVLGKEAYFSNSCFENNAPNL